MADTVENPSTIRNSNSYVISLDLIRFDNFLSFFFGNLGRRGVASRGRSLCDRQRLGAV